MTGQPAETETPVDTRQQERHQRACDEMKSILHQEDNIHESDGGGYNQAPPIRWKIQPSTTHTVEDTTKHHPYGGRYNQVPPIRWRIQPSTTHTVEDTTKHHPYGGEDNTYQSSHPLPVWL